MDLQVELSDTNSQNIYLGIDFTRLKFSMCWRTWEKVLKQNPIYGVKNGTSSYECFQSLPGRRYHCFSNCWLY